VSENAEAGEKNLLPCRGLNPGRPVCSQTLHWLSYPNSVSEALLPVQPALVNKTVVFFRYRVQIPIFTLVLLPFNPSHKFPRSSSRVGVWWSWPTCYLLQGIPFSFSLTSAPLSELLAQFLERRNSIKTRLVDHTNSIKHGDTASSGFVAWKTFEYGENITERGKSLDKCVIL
jgi:hypothetical protein